MPYDIKWTIAGDLRVESKYEVWPKLIVTFEDWCNRPNLEKLELLHAVVLQALNSPELTGEK